MRRRILVGILSVTAIAVVLFGVPLAIVADRFVDEDALLRIERQAVLASRNVRGDFATNADPVELPDGVDGIVLALYDRDGTLVTGDGPATADATTMRALHNNVADAETAGERIVAVPVSADERVVGAIRAAQTTAASDARSRRIAALLAVLGAGVIAVGAAIGYVVSGRLARPVRKLRDAAVQLGDGDFTIDVPRSRITELDQAARAMSATAHRLDDLVTRERAFSADVSHQLRTPLAGLRACIETELEYPRPDRTAALHEALGDVDRLEQTIAEILAIARTPRATSAAASLRAVLEDVDASWRGRMAAVGRPLTITDAHDAPTVRGNGVMLRHCLDVLLDNALDHGAGEVRVDHRVAAETVTISVTDEGPGFTDAALRSQRSPGADNNDGHGLGLPLARRLVESMPGRLAIARAAPRPQIDIVLQRADALSSEV